MKFILIIAASVPILFCYGCNNIKLSPISVRNCVKNPIISLQDNFKYKLTENCVLSIDYCYDFKPFKKASVELILYQGKTRKHSEKFELCNRNKKGKEITELIMSAFGLNDICPVTNETSLCSKDRKVFEFTAVKLTLAKAMFGKPGLLKLKTTLTHDTGKSCLEAELSIDFLK